ncbi:MAG: hypothetical protein Ct9H300mP11_03670 [Chloroflexota bacterium]|nr:MAG: hypothetical protein Ct9H300mP11_03670 [Chloroflexota bacterium]
MQGPPCRGKTAAVQTTTPYEYVGFGSTSNLGKQQLDEAEELLIKAWTEDNVNFQGNTGKCHFLPKGPGPSQKTSSTISESLYRR